MNIRAKIKSEMLRKLTALLILTSSLGVDAQAQQANPSQINDNNAISQPVKRKVGTGSDLGAASLHADATLSSGDYLELKCTNDTSASTITVQNLYLYVMGMIMV